MGFYKISHMGVALITSASSVIGAELTRLLCKHGFHVIGVTRSETDLEAPREELDTCFECQAIDLAMQESISEIEKQCWNHGHPNLLINNVGYAISKPVSEHSMYDRETLPCQRYKTNELIIAFSST